MKISGVLWSIIFISVVFGCTPPVTFDEPQPVKTKDLVKFPNRLKGEYVSLSDNSILRIGDKLIERVYDFDTRIHRNELDSTMILRNDTIVNLETNEKTFVIKMGDSLLAHVFYTDTLFQINSDHILRKMKGYCFLNTRYAEQNWEVKKLSLYRGKLTIGSISAESELEKLKEITESPQDTVPPYKFTATRKQFKKFVKQDGFTETETFIKR